ncbi:MAG: PAS domain S-box protein, partial [Chloroflexota bacterium]
ILILDAKTGLVEDVNPFLMKMLGYSREEFTKKKLWEVGAFKDIEASKAAFATLQEDKHIRYENLPLRTKDGRSVQVEFVSNVYQVGREKVIQCNIRDITDRKLVEEALAASEGRFRALIANSADAITMLDANGVVLYDSPAAPGLLGYAAGDWIGQEVFALLHPDELPHIRGLFQDLIQTPGAHISDTFRARHKNGEWLWLEFTATNSLADPSVEAIVLNYRDITARMQAQEAVVASERRFRALVENALDAIALIAVDGTILGDTPAAARLLGYEPGGLVGRNVFTLIHPEDVPQVSSLFQQLLQDPSTSRVSLFRFRHNDESWRWIEASGQNLLAEPSVQALVINYRDVTERNRAEAESAALLEIMQGAAATDSLPAFLALIRRALTRVLDAENLFVVLHDEATGMFEEVFAVDKYDPSMVPSRLARSITSYVFRTGQPLRLTGSALDDLVARGEVELVGTRPASWLGAPLKTPAEAIGVIAVQNYEDSHCYTDRDKTFLASVGAQVALAIQRKQAGEQVELRARELEALYDTSLEVSARISLDELLSAIVARANALLGTDGGGLYLLQPDRQSLKLVFAQSSLKDYIGVTLQMGEGLSGQVAQTGTATYVEDYQQWTGRSPVYDGTAFRRTLAIPLRVEDRVIGVIAVVDSRAPGSFSADELRLGTLFANQAALAIESARLYEQERARGRELSILYESAMTISSKLSLDVVLTTVIEQVSRA